MALGRRTWIGKLAYGAVFVAGLPLLLIHWAQATEHLVAAPPPHWPVLGALAIVAGITLALAGMAALWIHGGGWPMNAYPPPRLVACGPYRLAPHPIYAGFCLVCAGAAVVAGSSSGLWLVTPFVVLGCTALVLGYERIALRARFGPQANVCRLLPEDAEAAPDWGDRARCYLVVLLPWLVLYEAVVAIGPAPDAFAGHFAFERHLPVWGWTQLVYSSAYVVTAAVPLLARSRRRLRRFAIQGWLSMGLVIPAYLLLPLVSPPRPLAPEDPFARWLAWERSLDSAAASFPSYHVIWALLVAGALAEGSRLRRAAWWAWAVAAGASCVTTGMHAVVDVLGGVVVGVLVWRHERIWEMLRSACERIANSWREWRFGPVRVISHGAYAGLAAFLGVLTVGTLLGPRYAGIILLSAVSGLVAAGLWAQLIEGSPALLRPFGFYGGVLGVLAGSVTASWFGLDAWCLLAAWSVAAPVVQAVGRLRCLVQGCCHGRGAPETVGIHYRHPRSRVTRIAGLAGVPLHPAPLYSILSNLAIAGVLVRMWWLHAPANLIVGVYLLSSSLARFVEEGYRGEPQTPVIAGLRLYQWLAIAGVLAGALATTARGVALAPCTVLNGSALGMAALFGVLAAVALGVDFPASNRRFARLG